ncbi:MAG: DUF2127 domain-containing protein [Sphingomicrobium sp.]|jgi:uncharacterized membrane protein
MRRSRVKRGRVGSGVFQHRLHQLFLVSIAIKGAHALVELAGGVALYLFSTDLILQWLWEASRSHDWVARFAHGFSTAEHEFYAFYLVSHGVVNGAIVAGLLLGKRWSYHATFAVLSLFIGYQLYRYSYTRDIGLIVITVIDLIVMALAWNEYRLFKHHLQH